MYFFYLISSSEMYWQLETLFNVITLRCRLIYAIWLATCSSSVVHLVLQLFCEKHNYIYYMYSYAYKYALVI